MMTLPHTLLIYNKRYITRASSPRLKSPAQMSGSNMHMRSSNLGRHHFARPSHRYKRHTRLSSESPGTSDSATTPTWHQSRSTCHYKYIYMFVTHKGDLAIFTTSSNSSTWRHNALGQHADRATTITSQLCLYPQRCQLEYLNEYNNKYIYI